jgi:HSP20 family protein
MKSLRPFSNNGLIDELFRDFNPGYFIKPLHGDSLPSQIRVDVKENPNEYVIHAEIPGAGKENIHILIDGSVVTIRAEVSQVDSQNQEDKPLRSERYFGEVSRSFQLPVDIDESTSKANYENGVLTLKLQKKQKQAGQRLTIE